MPSFLGSTWQEVARGSGLPKACASPCSIIDEDSDSTVVSPEDCWLLACSNIHREGLGAWLSGQSTQRAVDPSSTCIRSILMQPCLLAWI